MCGIGILFDPVNLSGTAVRLKKNNNTFYIFSHFKYYLCNNGTYTLSYVVGESQQPSA
jgi:hypothetical protein